MKIYDVTMTIEYTMQVYKNKEEKKPIHTITRDFLSSNAMETHMSMDMHTGTHLDMPLHFVENGAPLETLDLHRVVTLCKVVDLTHVKGGITKEDLQQKDLTGVPFILLKTQNSYEDVFRFDFIYLKGDGAAYLSSLEIDGVGIDALGIERDQPSYETHKTLLGGGILILEGLRLKDVDEGRYQLIALPLKVKGAEAAPARVILIQE
jgi:arylformamidase